MITELFLIRHGEPQLTNALLGHTDSLLSDLGWQQLVESSAKLNAIDLVISSPLKRCAIFAEDFAKQHNLPLQFESQFTESNFGDWDGQPYQVLYEQFPQKMHEFFIDPANNTPPNGESLQDFVQRVESTLLRTLASHQGKRIALFMHSGVIRTLLAWCLQMDQLKAVQFQHISIDYGSLTHISVYAYQRTHFPKLRCTNQVNASN